MSYESEERYWTDYLRVALPVIGLLLMLALFWWWAQNFIGDDGDAGDLANATQTSIAAIATTAPPTPTNTQEVVLEPGTPTETEDEGNGEDEPTATEEPACDYQAGDTVVTNDAVNLREEPDSTGDNVIEELPAGTELQILADCNEEADSEDIVFWEVEVIETAKEGYVWADKIELPSE